MHILLVNDDGIHAFGLRELAVALAAVHTVTVVAPDRECSAIGHGITLREPLFVQKEEIAPGIKAYAVSGTPADCTRIGLDVLTESPVDLVISGINHGENIALDLLYSGTVSAALEAAIRGYRAIAVSAPRDVDFREAIPVFLRIFEQLDIEQDVRQVLNINIPALPARQIKEVSWVSQGEVRWEENYEQRESPDGRHYYWLHSKSLFSGGEEESDAAALNAGCVTLTPLTYSITDHEGFRKKTFSI